MKISIAFAFLVLAVAPQAYSQSQLGPPPPCGSHALTLPYLGRWYCIPTGSTSGGSIAAGTGISVSTVGGTSTVSIDSTVGVLQSQLQWMSPNYAPCTLSGSVYSCTQTPAPTAFTSGGAPMFLVAVPASSWTGGSVSLNNGISGKALLQPDGVSNPTASQIVAGVPFVAVYCSTCAASVGAWVMTGTAVVVPIYRQCDIAIGDTSSSALTNAQLGPQSRICFISRASTIVELDVTADAGTPNVIVGRNHAGTIVNIVSGALATAAAGGIACSNTGGTTGLDGATTCSSTLQNTALAAGDYLELVSGTAGGTAKFFVAHVTYSVN